MEQIIGGTFGGITLVNEIKIIKKQQSLFYVSFLLSPFQALPKSTEINANPVYCGFQLAYYFPGNLHHVLRIAILGW